MSFLWLAFWLFSLNASAGTVNQILIDYIDADPSDRYIVHDDGTVTDTTTSLMWSQCLSGQTYDSANSTCSGTNTFHTWTEALQAAQDSNYALYTDWRIPNAKELASIVALDRYSPAIRLDIFPGVELSIRNDTKSNYYWSSTPHSLYTDRSFAIGLHNNISGQMSYGTRTDATNSTFLVRSVQ